MIYKEWIKTRWFYLATTITMLAFSTYSLLNLYRVIRLKGAAHIWEVAITNDAIFVQIMQYLPIIAALIAALLQYMPEMTLKRLKLTLHLPCSEVRSVNSMLLYGIGMLAVVYTLCIATLGIGLSRVFAAEIVQNIVLTTIPWFMAGIACYCLTAWTVLEPQWKRRVLNILISAALLRMFFISDTPQAYNTCIWFLIVITVAAALLPHLSVLRFKAGKE